MTKRPNSTPDLSTVADVTDRAHKAQEDAQAASVRACRTIEGALFATLGGERFEGLPNLGTGSKPFRGVRVRSRTPDQALERPEGLASTGTEALCLDPFGRLVFAAIVRDPELHVASRPATDDELLAEDVELVARAANLAVAMHLDKSARSIDRYVQYRNLADRLDFALAAASLPIIHYKPRAGVLVPCGNKEAQVWSVAPNLVTCAACRLMIAEAAQP